MTEWNDEDTELALRHANGEPFPSILASVRREAYSKGIRDATLALKTGEKVNP